MNNDDDLYTETPVKNQALKIAQNLMKHITINDSDEKNHLAKKTFPLPFCRVKETCHLSSHNALETHHLSSYKEVETSSLLSTAKETSHLSSHQAIEETHLSIPSPKASHLHSANPVKTQNKKNSR